MQIDWQKCGGLIPVLVQDSANNEILMLAYMNEEALKLSMQTGLAHYFSRSKGRIWQKGESSANVQKIKQIKLDCDADALLIKVEQIGAACHTGQKSCFFNDLGFDENNAQAKASVNAPKYNILDELYHTCLKRKLSGDATSSYTAKLYKKGPNAYLKKICEEASEFSFAIKDLQSAINMGADALKNVGEHKKGEPEYDVIYEGADVIFHLLVALADVNIHPERLLAELARRQGISGIDEKNSRKND